MQAARVFCPSCAASNEAGGRYCRACGDTLGPAPRPAPVAPAPAAVSSRSGFFHALLVVVTLGLWFPFWFGMTWGDAKRAAGVGGMPGFWHGLLLFVPIVNLVRIHAHYQTLRDGRGRWGLTPSLRAGLADVGWVLAVPLLWLTGRAVWFLVAAATNDRSGMARAARGLVSDPMVGIALVLSLPLLVLMVAAGQRALNGIARAGHG